MVWNQLESSLIEWNTTERGGIFQNAVEYCGTCGMWGNVMQKRVHAWF